jgi:hypothetical protein
MDPMTEQTPVREAVAFYDWLAPDYDSMTGFQKRFAHEKRLTQDAEQASIHCSLRSLAFA